ncbi:hypothetical protein BsWGS_05594 [Bradybaena similaris]
MSALKNKSKAGYAEAHRVRKCIRKDKKEYVEELTTEAEKASNNGNLKQLHDITRRLSGKFSRSEHPVNDKQGKNIPEIEQQMNRWAEHFEELLNRPPPSNPPDIVPAESDLPISCDKPNREEIKTAIKRMRLPLSYANRCLLKLHGVLMGQ